MSNRQERRAAKAAARKAGKGKGGLAQKILGQAAEWLNGEAIDLEEIGIDDPGFERALDRVVEELGDLLGENLPDFLGYLNDEAMSAEVAAMGANGRPLLAMSQVFFLPVHGPEHEVINLLADDGDFGWLVRSFRAHGVAAQASNIRLLRGFIHPEEAVDARPSGIRKVALDLLRHTAVEGGLGSSPEDSDRETLAILGGNPATGKAEKPDEVLIVSRLVVGVRTLVVDMDNDPEDWPVDYLSYFMSPEAAEALVAEDGGEPYETDDMGKELSSWLDDVQERLGDTGILLEPPQSWTSAIGSMARNRLLSTIGIEKAMLGIEQDATPDMMHVHQSEDRILVALEFGERLVGPVDVHRALIEPDAEIFLEVLTTIAPVIQWHEDVGTLLDLRDVSHPKGLH